MYVPDFLSSFSIFPTSIFSGSKATRLISLEPRQPLSIDRTPERPSRAYAPTSYHLTTKVASAWPLTISPLTQAARNRAIRIKPDKTIRLFIVNLPLKPLGPDQIGPARVILISCRSACLFPYSRPFFLHPLYP